MVTINNGSTEYASGRPGDLAVPRWNMVEPGSEHSMEHGLACIEPGDPLHEAR